MKRDYDFAGWATRSNILCSDGRVIMNNAFADNDGQSVPLVWNHDHNNPENVLGHAVLENRGDGVYAYGYFNDSETGQIARKLIEHGDVNGLSIYANQLKQNGSNVLHGNIRELSLVLATANPEAYIETVVSHSGTDSGEEAIIYMGDNDILIHSDGGDQRTIKDIFDTLTEEQKNAVYAIIGSIMEGNELGHSDDFENDYDDYDEYDDDMTVGDVLDTLDDDQREAVNLVIDDIVNGGDYDDYDDYEEDYDDDYDYDDYDEEEYDDMKHNVFDNDMGRGDVLTHGDQEAILELAKSNSCGSLQAALDEYLGDGEFLQHGFAESINEFFPEYKDVYPGAPELITRDASWISAVMNGVQRSPISRIRTRQTDVRDTTLHAEGYGKKGTKKKDMGNVKLVKRTTDPQTIYIKDSLNRDDIIDITDFDVVNYQYQIMDGLLKEELAKAILIGDGRAEGDENKIEETHIRPVWTDDELYTIHADVDIAKTKEDLQGTGTSVSFGDNYIYAEAIIQAALYAREQYKGSGSLNFFCTPHLLNIMLLARDMNGRRIYDSKTDLAAALNVGSIITVEQFEGKTRKTKDEEAKTKKLLGLFVNLNDYRLGSTKGGEITRFNQFDIDFNQQKYLIETRLSGALTRIKSAIALEEEVVA